MGVDDVTDEEEYNKVEDMTPFVVEVDTSILLAKVEAKSEPSLMTGRL